MPTLSRVRGGIDANAWGKAFENMVVRSGIKHGITVIRIPDGCETRRGARGPRVVRVRSPFDFVLLKRTQAVVFDAKTTAETTFKYSNLTEHQLGSLKRCSEQAKNAGYLVFFRNFDEVVFYNIDILSALRPGKSVKPGDGMILGRSSSIGLDSLFK